MPYAFFMQIKYFVDEILYGYIQYPYFIWINLFNPHHNPPKIDAIIILILRRKKLRHEIVNIPRSHHGW